MDSATQRTMTATDMSKKYTSTESVNCFWLGAISACHLHLKTHNSKEQVTNFSYIERSEKVIEMLEILNEGNVRNGHELAATGI